MLRKLLFVALWLLAALQNINAQATISAQVFAEIIEALTAHETEQLNFGRFSPETSGGSIAIHPNGARTALGSVVLAAGYFGPGKFSITGAPNAAFSVQLPPGPAVLMNQQSSKTMIVEDWVSDQETTAHINLMENGAQLISIGATLKVGTIDKNPAGLYAGTFQLTFAYN